MGGKKFDVDKLSKNVIGHDAWDLQDLRAIQKEMREFQNSQERLGNHVETGFSAFSDTFYSLLKANPELLKKGDVRPSHYVNRRVLEEAMGLTEMDELRMYSVGDLVAAAIASVAMEDDLKTLFDKLEKEREQAKQLEQMMGQAQALQDQLDDAEPDPDSPPDEGEAQNFQEMQDQMDALMERIAAAEQELEDNLEEQGTSISIDMKTALKGAIEEAESVDGVASLWGAEPGSLRKLNPEKRIELAQKMRSDRLKKLAELFGAMQRMAFAERAKRTIHSRDEIYDIELGSDLARILPMELVSLEDEALEMDFYRRFYENALYQYQLRGEEKLARGGIIWCEDGSGSMSGDRELWAKAVGLVLLQIAKSQKRPFYSIMFGSVGQLKIWDFRDTSNITPDTVLDYAGTTWGGGTDFVTPLNKALEIIKGEHAEGHIKSDIVFATDGMCPVPPPWLEAWGEERANLGFTTYGVAIGCPPDSEPLNAICNNKVVGVRSLTSGNDLRPIFGAL